MTSHESNMSAGPAGRWGQVQQSFPMNSDPTRAVYKKCYWFHPTSLNSLRSRPTGSLGSEGSNHCWAKRRARHCQTFLLALSHLADIIIQRGMDNGYSERSLYLTALSGILRKQTIQPRSINSSFLEPFSRIWLSGMIVNHRGRGQQCQQNMRYVFKSEGNWGSVVHGNIKL